ncbi:MAG: efflux RND transporter periplasmic adaptor subunit [Planctomycetota bacterium]
MTINRIAVFVSAAVLTVAGAIAQDESQGPPPSPVRADAAVLEVIGDQTRVTGNLRPKRRASVAVEEAGLVIELATDEGERVAAGDVLARLDSDVLGLELAAAEQDRTVAEAQATEQQAWVEFWQQELQALENARSRGAVNDQELRRTRTELATSRARLSIAENSVSLADARAAVLRQRLNDTTLRAPFAGIVVRMQTELGQWANQGDTVLELVEIDTLEAWLDVPQRLLPTVSAGNVEASIRIDATGETKAVQKSRAVRDVNPVSRSFTLIGDVSNADGMLAPGASVIGFVPTGERVERLTIHKDAVQRNDTGQFVYVVTGPPDAAVARPVRIKPLFQTASRVVIEAGSVNAGDQLVTEGAARLFPMSPVRVNGPAKAQAAANGSN